MNLPVREEIVCGKRRIIIKRKASGVDKTKEAVLLIMGRDKWEYKEDISQAQ
ncbi:hypothetical protein [Clostridium hydrogenum]|uniref:hypothetical protein n=1 Tax=Clostridium hydrogenum TaxID=2855764 RepID=UPI001F1FB682|nr:hypothetical protein [Clostridium hydrogenum]